MYFSTQSFEQSKRSQAWHNAIEQQCGPYIYEFSNGNVQGVIDARKVGRFDCARFSQTAREMHRTWREISQGDPQLYVLVVQLAGKCEKEQLGRKVVLEPGDITIIDSTLPSHFNFERRNTQFAMHIPKFELSQSGVDWENHLATLCPSSTAAMMRSLITTSFEHFHPFGGHQIDAFSQALLSILIAGYKDLEGSNKTNFENNQSNLLKSIQDYVIRNLSDENLTPSVIAKAHGISERQLHRFFNANGLTLCRWIKQSRLDRCAMDLRDTSLNDKSITEIAYKWGFNDSAHFSRAFRTEYDKSPREYRVTEK